MPLHADPLALSSATISFEPIPQRKSKTSKIFAKLPLKLQQFASLSNPDKQISRKPFFKDIL